MSTDMNNPFARNPRHRSILCLLACVVLSGCAGAAPSGDASKSASSASTRGTPKRIVAAIQGNPLGGYAKLDANNSQRGNQEFAGLVHAGLTVGDPTGQVQAQMAEAVPSVTNGLWTI